MPNTADPTPPTVYLLYGRIFSADGSELTVGGIQTYLVELAEAIKAMHWRPVLVQEGTHDFDRIYRGIEIQGRTVKQKMLWRRAKLWPLYQRIQDQLKPERDILVWGTMEQAARLPRMKTISIQHGIGFDIVRHRPLEQKLKRLGLAKLQRHYQRQRALKALPIADRVVCVDYNFQNWYRTFSMRDNDECLNVIPNSTEIPDWPIEEKNEFRRILFARRFSYERGSSLMIEVAERLLSGNPNLLFTFAGDGPYRAQIEVLRSRFPQQVEICQYQSHESLAFHRTHDISVVPTIGSEGTSLSLLEAMAAGCAVVCTDVGGMTNIVVDRFNGRMTPPTVSDLASALQELIDAPRVTNQMRTMARATVENGFSRTLWRQRWEQVLRNLQQDAEVN